MPLSMLQGRLMFYEAGRFRVIFTKQADDVQDMTQAKWDIHGDVGKSMEILCLRAQFTSIARPLRSTHHHTMT